MAENHVREDASAEEDGGNSSVDAPFDAVTEGAADSVDQMDLAVPSKETRAAEDGVREDMFVDCPDEIETSESQQSSEEKDILQNDQTNELDSGIKVQQVVAEIELLRDKLDMSVSEKEHLAQQYEEERAMFMRELSDLCSQLKVSSEQLIPADENADGFDVGSSSSLHDMISECSRFLKYAVDGRLQTEEKVRELHSVLYAKDQEIDFLNAKVADLTESSNISQSNSISEHDKLSQIYEVQLKKDQQIEEITNRIIASVSTVHHQEELWGGSLTDKISNIEKSVAFLVERYNLFVSESGQLKECLNGAGLDLDMIDDVGTFRIARDRILEHRRKEEDMYQNLSSLGDENRKLMEELEKRKSILENMKAEIRRLNAEVEQEQKRYANTKEKLSMAVTKGKALVQQRDSLKQSLLEKTSQLEKCSVELQEKTSALDDAEKTKELLAASEKLAAFLQDSLAEKEMILGKCGEILLESFATHELQTTDITEKLRWLADEYKSLNDISLQYHKLSDALSSFDFPETVGSSELDVCVRWLAESLNLSKEEAARLQSEIVETKEAAKKEIEHLTTSLLAEIQDRSYLEVELEDIRSKGEAHERLQHELGQARESVNNEIDHLTSSLLAESQEKSSLQLELENLRQKYEGVIEKENLVSLEKDKLVSMLLEASGLAKDGQGDIHPENSDTGTIIYNCLEKIRENAHPTEPSLVETEILESLKSLLYIRDQEMTLCKLIIEEYILDCARVGQLSNELNMRTQEFNTLKDEKAVMQKSLEQLEERCALLKEKLSMAVKKGKGLVQDRENLKSSLSEKNTEIDSLKSELQQNISRYAECQDQITKLLVDVERISVLETDLTSSKERGDQLVQFLSESNSMLQRVMESIEAITAPTNLFFNDPVEKVKWISGYLRENEILKTQMEQELMNVKDEVSSLSRKLSEVQTTLKSHEDALSIAENSRSELLDEKKALEVSKVLLEEELQKEKESASSHTSEFEELLVRNKALEDALSVAEDNASRFTSERDAAEEQIKKLTEELSDHITKFSDAEKTIQSLEESASSRISEFEELLVRNKALEDALSVAEDNASRFTSERDAAEERIKKLTEELSDHITKFADAEKTIQSLEDALSLTGSASSRTSEFEELLVRKKALEDALSVAEDNASSFTSERDAAVEQIKRLTEELSDQITKFSDAEKTIQSLEESASSRTSEFEELLVRNKALEDALSVAEDNASRFTSERDAAEEQIKKLTEELSDHITKFSDAEKTIQSLEESVSSRTSEFEELLVRKKALEDALSVAEDNASSFTSERDAAVEQIKRLTEELSDQITKFADAEKTIQSLEESASSRTSEFEELLVRNKALEDALSVAEENASRFTSEREAAEERIKKLTEDLSDHITKFADAEKTIQSLEDALSLTGSASSRTSEFEELLVRKKALEDALSVAEDNASSFTSERDAAVEQIKRLTEELSDHITKFADAEKTIQSLEDALSHAQKNISLLSDESSKVQIGQADLEGEIKRIREEADAYTSKLSDASTTIKSLEDALLNAESNIAELAQEKKNAEQELGSCMEELAGIRSSIENRSLELSDQLSHLQRLLEDETLSTLVIQCFQKKFESLKSIEFLLKEMWDCFLDIDSDVLQNSLVVEDASLSTASPFNSDVVANMEKVNDEVIVVDTENLMLHFEKMVERFHLKGKTLADKFDHVSTLFDESITTVLRRLHITKEKTIDAVKYTSFLKDQLKDIQMDKKRQDDTIASLESDIKILLSACNDATQGLETNVHKNVSELRSIHELVNRYGGISMDLGAVENDAASELSTVHVKKAEKLLLATRQSQDLSKLFQEAISKLVSMTEDMHNKLKETQLTYDEVLEERDLYKGRIVKLETDLIAHQKLYSEIEIKLEEYMEREDEFRKRESKLSTSSSKVHEFEDSLSPSEVKSILDKINQVNIPETSLTLGDSNDSANARKLLYVIDSYSKSLNKVSSLSLENEELQSTIDQQILEIEQLRRQVEDYTDNEKDSQKLSELESGLQIIVQKLGGGDLMYDSKVDGLMPLLDKLVTARVVESESLKLKNGELGDELFEAQKAVDELSNNVKLLEESNQTRVVIPEIIQEREASVSSMSTQPEISEMQEMGAVGKSNNVPSAAHVRTLLRKGSSDHLAINIESESERLINDKGSDEDKGHVFKSLVGSGLIPRQGRTFADRIDGVWVSSSRALMRHPRGRLGVVVYWLVLHIWLLGSIL